MNKNTEFEIVPHENGWAVLAGSVIKGVYPSRYLAVTAMNAQHGEFVLTDEAASSRASTDVMPTDSAVSRRNANALNLTIAVPYQVDIPLKCKGGEINIPVSPEGRELATWKL
ncbi:hypothetical protein G6L32_26120 [Agrobacterium tumefaciens]|uniref:hypothetical protein n=1 Tax=Agrobacterium TaxID=357 RepID=UPI000FDF41B9|nr:hypothetical protein [Agrobacterium sp. RS6]NSZ77124.1 hypothetical protein [Agrobacterium tumefaciens]NTA13558.1 hypothetical protein [Agrobacterium tumefaciens]NTA62104.1 hypothetical protein [Agrobacterium tumefaciens]UXR95000.1 hypothetical protein FY157_25115 [Agrobacterium tumefaciens]